MTRGVPPLTIAQKTIIQNNLSKFSADIMKLPGMEGTSRRQIQDYRKRIGTSDEEYLVDVLEEYIAVHGLPLEFSCIMRYIRYLKTRM